VFRYNSCLCATVISVDLVLGTTHASIVHSHAKWQMMTAVLRVRLRNCRLITSFYALPYWSCIFRSCFFGPFQVLHFYVVTFGSAFSGPAFSVDPWCSNFLKFGRQVIGDNRWNRALFTRQKQKQKISPAYQTVATARIAPKICQGLPPTMYSECSRFYLNWFIYGGLTAERVNTAKSAHKVNPIFGRSLASSRIIILSDVKGCVQLFETFANPQNKIKYFSKL